MRKGSRLSEEQRKKISEACKGRKRRPCSEETKRKISEATTGVKKTIIKPNSGWFKKGRKSESGFKKGHIPWIKGKKMPPEFRKAIGDRKRGKGSKRYNWNYKEWRRHVLERDCYKCMMCGTVNDLTVHHIIPWKDNKKLRFDVDNGIAYCRSCHGKVEGYQKGHSHTDEVRKKLSIANKGKPSPLKGKKLTEEHKKKLSDAHIGQKAWNKGKYTNPEPIRKCKICGIEKDINLFTPQKKDGKLYYRTICKDCRNEKLRLKR